MSLQTSSLTEKPKKLLTNDTEEKVAKKKPLKKQKIGRNDPCPCGSGKKYKQCCGKQRINKRLMKIYKIQKIVKKSQMFAKKAINPYK